MIASVHIHIGSLVIGFIIGIICFALYVIYIISREHKDD
jgi:hypothetical protein